MGITISYLIILIITLCLVVIATLIDTPSLLRKYGEKRVYVMRNILLIIILALIIYLCIQNFPVSLTLLVIFTGIIALIDLLFFARGRKKTREKPSVIVENARSFFPVLLLVWIIRSFLIQMYHVPSGSLEPTVLPGDLIVVKQYAYGLRFPIGNFKLVDTGEPKLGEIALFYWPVNLHKVLVKRVIGTPGDHIVYKDKVLYINGHEAKQTFLFVDEDIEPGQLPVFVYRMQENLNGINHQIFINPVGGETQNFDIVVPKGMYFMMGDNRDVSDDSRSWGFVPERNLIGKAFRIVLSWDSNKFSPRWHRFGKDLYSSSSDVNVRSASP